MVSDNFFLDQIRITLTSPGIFGIQKVEDINWVFFQKFLLTEIQALKHGVRCLTIL